MRDALIIGGGIIGLTAALELQQRGFAVTLLEKGRPGDGASGAAGGVLSPLQPWRNDAVTMQLHSLSLSRYRHLLDDLQVQGESVLLTENGLLCLAPDQTHAASDWAETQGRLFIELDAEALAGEEPALDAEAAFLFPQVCQLEPGALLGALARTAERRGICIREHCAARAMEVKKERASGVHTDAGFIAADVVVVCAGAWLTSLLPEWLPRPEIRPVRGQIIEYAAETGLLRHIVSSEAPETGRCHYLIPRPDGHLLVGSTLEHCGFDNSITAEARAELAGFAERLVPALTRHSISRQWAGLRPAPARAVPLIGAHPDVANLFISGGHYRNGISLAPASALLLAQLICAEETAMDMKAFEING